MAVGKHRVVQVELRCEVHIQRWLPKTNSYADAPAEAPKADAANAQAPKAKEVAKA